MKTLRAKPVMKFVVLAATTIALLLVFTTSLLAQNRGNPIEVFNAQREAARNEALRQRELEQLRENAGKKPIITDQRQRMAMLARIKEDFVRIQVLNNEMYREAFVSRPPAYESISEKAADIKKRAARLRDSIKFYEPEGEKKVERTADEFTNEPLKISLLKLRNLMARFANNPLFQQNLGVIDIEQSAQASRDIRDIILMCDVIGKSAKRLDKTAKP